jgi:hypothetical protein
VTPIKPIAGSFSPVLPKGWSRHFIPLLNATPDSDLVAGFCGRFLSALNGNEAAFMSCCQLIATVTRIPQDRLTAAEKRHIAGIVTLTKMLVERFDKAEADRTKTAASK